jgi:hypothetical protein
VLRVLELSPAQIGGSRASVMARGITERGGLGVGLCGVGCRLAASRPVGFPDLGDGVSAAGISSQMHHDRGAARRASVQRGWVGGAV